MTHFRVSFCCMEFLSGNKILKSMTYLQFCCNVSSLLHSVSLKSSMNEYYYYYL